MSRFVSSVNSKYSVIAGAVLSFAITGCRQDMHNQPKFVPQRGTSFFTDGRSVRPQVAGTVSRSQGDVKSYFLTGLVNGAEADGMPLPVTPALLARGQERYNIYCTPCHSRVGNGEGMIVQRGYYQATSMHSERLRQAPLGHFVSVMLNGYGAMPMYATELPPADRWAVAAYIRALQLSQNAKTEDAPHRDAILPLKQIAAREGMAPGLAETHWGITATKSVPVVVIPVTKSEPTPDAKPVADVTTPASPTPSETPAKNPVKVDKTAEGTATPAPKPVVAAGDSVAGLAVYTANCKMCHQETRAGNPPMIPSLVDIVPRVGKEHIREVVTNGISGGKIKMPAFGDRLSSTDIDNLLAYLKSAK
jgi:mono/diheme cytochrome c family protein